MSGEPTPLDKVYAAKDETELAEAYAAVGRAAEAAEAARRALPLLLEADPGFANDASRSSRLQLLAG